PDQERASTRPHRQGGDVERVGDNDVVGGAKNARDRLVPAGMEVEQMTPDRLLVHRTVGRSVETLGGLGAPPHGAVLRIRTAKSVTEEAAPSEGRLNALAYAGVLDQRPRYKATEADQTGIERSR